MGNGIGMSRRAASWRTRAALTAIVLTAGALAGCSSPAPVEPSPTVTPTPVPPSGDGVLRVGTLFPATGPLAFLAPAQVAGVNAAVREINAAGGVGGAPVEVLSRDSGDAGSPTAEASLADLAGRAVDAVVGPSSSAIAQRLLSAAAEAAIPLVSPSATYPQLDVGDDPATSWFFRTIPSYPQQATPIVDRLADAGAETVVLLHAADEVSTSMVAAVTAAADEAGITATAVAAQADAAATATAALADDPDAVVLATPDNGAATLALIGALRAAGLAPDALWLTSQNTADYSQALPAGLLAGAHAIVEGAMPSAEFAAKVRQEDPAVGDLRYAAEAYDATVLIALAAVLADDDGGASIAAALRAASADGVKCGSFGECLAAIDDGQDVDYDGVSGPVNLGEAHRPGSAGWTVSTYGADNKPAAPESVVG